MERRFLTLKAVLAAGLAAGAVLLGTASASGAPSASAYGRFLGVVPRAGVASYLTAHSPAATPSGPAGNLVYHRGGVMRTNTTYAIYWWPTNFGAVPDSYESIIDQYFTDVAAASGTTSNVYSVATQYYDTVGGGQNHVAYTSFFGGSAVDTQALPSPSHCFQGGNCLTDADYQAAVKRALLANPTWQTGPSTMFFVMTPPNVASCFDGTAASPCTNSNSNGYCAYHGAFNNPGPVIYAVEPYNGSITGCSTGASPNGNQAADDELNTISHEHNEAITDPGYEGSPSVGGWWDSGGAENGDKCAWNFGTPTGNYNQTINGHHYMLQLEWSNDGSACLGGYDPNSPPSQSTDPSVSGTAAVGKTLTTTHGGWVYGPTSYTYYWQRCARTDTTTCADVAGPSTQATYTLVAADAGHTIRSEVVAHNAFGDSAPAYSALTPAVVDVPDASAAPSLTGLAGVGRTLTTTTGTWSFTPSSYAYEWLRCDAAGASCVQIPNSTAQVYQLTSADAGHTIRSAVAATNIAGTSSYVPSAQTDVVVPRPSANPGPVVSGTAAVGHDLSTTDGTWNSPVTYAYQWLRCATKCSAIADATSSTYTLTAADAGHTIEARVSGTNAAGTAQAVSAPTAVVVDVPAASAPPRISGRTKVGRTLSASTGAWTYAPAGYAYRWLRCGSGGGSCTTIAGATGATYKLVKKDAKHRIAVQVTATNDAGSGKSTSAPTAVVKR